MKKLRWIAAMVILFAGMCAVQQISAKAAEKITVVIDPGHGGSGILNKADLGAQYHGVMEKDLNLNVAKAMRQELEQYGNVKVYMTREDDRALDLEERVKFADQVGADVLISIHFNASEDHNFFGSEVWVSAFSKFHATGYGIGNYALDGLEELGFVKKGVKTRIGKRGTDYYGIIRHGVEYKIPAMIIEHAYIDQESDWEKINSEGMIEKLGISDAKAVASYYGLQKGVELESVSPAVQIEVPSAMVKPDTTKPTDVKLTIEKYNIEENKLTVTAEALEAESRLLYYTYSLDEGETWQKLQLWQGKDAYTFEIPVPEQFCGNVIPKVYNTYELYEEGQPVSCQELYESEKAKKEYEEAIEESKKQAEEKKQKQEQAEKEEIQREIQKQKEKKQAVVFFCTAVVVFAAGGVILVLSIHKIQDRNHRKKRGIAKQKNFVRKKSKVVASSRKKKGSRKPFLSQQNKEREEKL